MLVRTTNKGKGILKFSLEVAYYLCGIQHAVVVWIIWIIPYDQISSSQLIGATFEISMKFLKGNVGSTATESNFYSYNCSLSTFQSFWIRANTCSVPTCKQHICNIPLPTVKLVQNFRHTNTQFDRTFLWGSFSPQKWNLLFQKERYQIVTWITSSFPFCTYV